MREVRSGLAFAAAALALAADGRKVGPPPGGAPHKEAPRAAPPAARRFAARR